MRHFYLFIGWTFGMFTGLVWAQDPLTFQQPSASILAWADYQRPPGVMLDEQHRWMVFTQRDTYKTLQDLNQEELRLAGLRINTIWRMPSNVTFVKDIHFRKINEKEARRPKGLPEHPQLVYLTWSPDQTQMACLHLNGDIPELWVINWITGQAQRWSELQPNAVVGNPINWAADSQSILLRCQPAQPIPFRDPKRDLPTGPSISTSDGKVSQNRTYPDLLRNATDANNLEALLLSDYHWVFPDGHSELWLSAQVALGESIAPDGQYVLVTALERPYSYLVPLSRFPQRAVVYTRKGERVNQVNHLTLHENQPKGFSAVRKGRRQLGWRSDKPHTLWYVMALDEGDPAKKVPYRDGLYTWDAPFDTEPLPLMKVPQRFSGVIWGDDTHAIVTDDWYESRNSKTYLINPSNPTVSAKVLFDRNTQDAYKDPGRFETRSNAFHKQVLALENEKAYLIGDGFTDKGQFPFVSRMDLNSKNIQKIYTANRPGRKEDIIEIVDFQKMKALVSVEGPTEYPNYYYCNLSNGKLEALTHFKSPFENIPKPYKQLINYKRKDGLALHGTLYLPADYNRQKSVEKLPLLIWAYPEEFKDKNSAGQNRQNPNEFTYPNYASFIYWVNKGYAVLDDASFPIIGEGKAEPNDTFLPQLIQNAEAAIQAVAQLGYIDPSKAAIGGHSYGAFMVANLLTHTSLFACGIARSGAYNRTLTPLGFQNESRNYWDAPEVYTAMSPFMHAQKMKTPLLLIHGDADNNPGTFTLQSERYFQALKSLGAPVRLVLLPKESHSYVAKENIFHLLWEEEQFLDTYLKPRIQQP